METKAQLNTIPALQTLQHPIMENTHTLQRTAEIQIRHPHLLIRHLHLLIRHRRLHRRFLQDMILRVKLEVGEKKKAAEAA